MGRHLLHRGSAEERLQLDVAHLDLTTWQAQGVGTGGSLERVVWDSDAAQTPADLVADRHHGPVFLARRAPSAGQHGEVAALDAR